MEQYLKSSLSQEQAKLRVSCFSNSSDNLSYNVFLKLKKGDSYEGFSTTIFDLSSKIPNFFIEFAGTTIKEIILNGNLLPTSDNYESLRDKRFLRLPDEHLIIGKNELKIKFANLYTKDGQGLHTYTDTDNAQYLYSQGEAYAMNKIFPCFDQPDLKAPLTLTLAIPNDWVAISNEQPCPEKINNLDLGQYLTEDEKNTFKVIPFKTTPKISIYLYAIIAGEYQEFKCETPYNNIPMSCYCRKTMVDNLQKQLSHVFQLTIEGIKFFESFFGYKYPFSKHDHIFCAEFNSGAMENVGAITYNDSTCLARDTLTKDKISRISRTIIHELSHMWFGDLVTMRWWNDLWLNESFADFMAFFCISKIRHKLDTPLIDPWVSFIDRKSWGYSEDQLKTTHPIACEVINTEKARSIFDGITYSKGGAVLKQLLCLIGEENFSKALHQYFNKHQWKNTVLDDFIEALNENYKPLFKGAPESLLEWQKEWLEAAGMDELEPEWSYDPSNNELKIIVSQVPVLPEFPTLRHHKIKIALFNESAQVFEAIDAVILNQPETVITHKCSQKPMALFLNYQDETFAKIRIDATSLAFLKAHLGNLEEDLTKELVWRALFDMVRDAKLSCYQFFLIAKQAIFQEKDEDAQRSILKYCSSVASLGPSALTKDYIYPELYEIVYKLLIETDPKNKDRVSALQDHLISFAGTGKSKDIDNVSTLIAWLDGKHPQLSKYKLSQANKWSIMSKLYKYKHLDNHQRRAYFQKIAETDKTDTMKRQEAKFEAIMTPKNLRPKLWASYLDPNNKNSKQILAASMSGYKQGRSKEEKEKFFEVLLDVFKNRTSEFAKQFFSSFFPDGDDLVYSINKIKEIRPKAEGDWLPRLLDNMMDNLERKRKIYLCCAPDLLNLAFNIKY